MRLVRNLVLQILKERFYNVQLSIFVHCHPRTQSSQRLESQQLFLFVRCHPRKLGSQRLESQAPAPVSVPVSRALLSKGPAGSCNAFPLDMQIGAKFAHGGFGSRNVVLLLFPADGTGHFKSMPVLLQRNTKAQRYTLNLCPFFCSGTRKRNGIL